MAIEGLEEILAALEAVPDKVMEGATIGVHKAVQRIVRTAKQKAPVDTGQLRQMIHGEVHSGSGAVVGDVIASAEHAPYVEFGTGPRGQASYRGSKAIAYNQTGWTTKHKVGIGRKKPRKKRRG